MPETKMEKLLFSITTEPPIGLIDSEGCACEITAESMSVILNTTPQVIGKVMKWCWYLWERKIVNGKVVYVPIKE